MSPAISYASHSFPKVNRANAGKNASIDEKAIIKSLNTKDGSLVENGFQLLQKAEEIFGADATYKHIGGRKSNDCNVYSTKFDEQPRLEIKVLDASFPHVTKLPQALQVNSNKFTFISEDYPSFYYKYFLPQICDIYSIQLPDFKNWMKYIHQDCYKKLDLFDILHESDNYLKNLKKIRESITKNSIKLYLEKHGHRMIDINSYNDYVFNIFHLRYFLFFSRKEREYNLIESNVNMFLADYLKYPINNNTLVFASKNKNYEIHFYLRWKNHIGVLYPALQISIRRISSRVECPDCKYMVILNKSGKIRKHSICKEICTGSGKTYPSYHLKSNKC